MQGVEGGGRDITNTFNLWPKIKFCAKRASKIIVPPKEMLLSFSIGTFLTTNDVTCGKLNTCLLYPRQEQ